MRPSVGDETTTANLASSGPLSGRPTGAPGSATCRLDHGRTGVSSRLVRTTAGRGVSGWLTIWPVTDEAVEDRRISACQELVIIQIPKTASGS